MAKEKFEEALGKLEKIVSKLERGEVSLEESLKLFEEGVRLSRFCNQKLEEAEKRVDILLKDRDGNPKVVPFEPAENSGKIPTGSAFPSRQLASEEATSDEDEETSPDREE